MEMASTARESGAQHKGFEKGDLQTPSFSFLFQFFFSFALIVRLAIRNCSRRALTHMLGSTAKHLSRGSFSYLTFTMSINFQIAVLDHSSRSSEGRHPRAQPSQRLSGRHRGIASLVFSHRGSASKRISAARTRIARIFSENSRRLWLFLGSVRGFSRKTPGKSRENCWNIFPEAPNATNSRISGTGKGKPAGNLGSTLP